MTIDEWCTSADGFAMLKYLKHKTVATPRRLFLFTCASLRAFFSDQPAMLERLDVAERFAEYLATPEERALASHHRCSG